MGGEVSFLLPLSIISSLSLFLLQLDSSVKKSMSAPAAASQKRKLQRSSKSPLRLWMTSAPLPAISVKNPNLLTIEDLPMIRRRVRTVVLFLYLFN